MSRILTQSLNAIERAGFTDPYSISIRDMLRIPGLGPKGIAAVAQNAQNLQRRRLM